MTFADYYLLAVLRAAGWPRKTGVPFFRKERVDLYLVRMVIEQMVQVATVLGAVKPGHAVTLLADSFKKRNWAEQPAQDLWDSLDPTEKVKSHAELGTVRTITDFALGDSAIGQRFGKEVGAHYVRWDWLKTKPIAFYYNMTFVRALVWGLSHPEEVLADYEAEREKGVELQPQLVEHWGVDIDPRCAFPPTIEQICEFTENLMESFQAEVHPLGEVPQELAALPVIASRTKL